MRRQLFVASLAIVAVTSTACGSSSHESGRRSEDASSASSIPAIGGERSSSATSAAASATTAAAASTSAPAYQPMPSTTAASGAAVTAPYAVPPAGDDREVAPPPGTPTMVDNRSSFALDVDTASYTIARNQLRNGVLPDTYSVRTEEFVNFFDQGWPEAEERGLTIRADGARVPFLADSHRVLRVSVQGQAVPASDRKPANLTFVVDTSGSMADSGKLDLVKAGLHRLVRSLGRDDTVEIVSFSNESRVVLERTHVTDGGEARIGAAIDGLWPEGSTNVQAGLALGYRGARGAYERGAVNRVVLATDGIANTGATTAEQILSTVSEEAGKGIQLAAVGVGFGSYNDDLLEQLADKGDGFYAYVDQIGEAERLFAERLTSTLQTVALDGKAEVRFNPEVVRSYRLLGYDDRGIPDGSLQDPTVDGGETGAGHVTTAVYDIELSSSELSRDSVLATAMVHWTDPDITTGRDRALDITLGQVERSFGDAAARFRLAVWTAAFAERLRGGAWSVQVGLGSVRTGVDQVARQLDGDADVAELARLVSTAASLRD